MFDRSSLRWGKKKKREQRRRESVGEWSELASFTLPHLRCCPLPFQIQEVRGEGWRKVDGQAQPLSNAGGLGFTERLALAANPSWVDIECSGKYTSLYSRSL